jgi:hypothetical protein
MSDEDPAVDETPTGKARRSRSGSARERTASGAPGDATATEASAPAEASPPIEASPPEASPPEASPPEAPPTPEASPTAALPAAIAGTWTGPARITFHITIADGAPQIEATDARTGRPYETHDVQWDGERLDWTLTIPRSGITLHYTATPADDGRMTARWHNAARTRAELPPALRNRPIALAGVDDLIRR